MPRSDDMHTSQWTDRCQAGPVRRQVKQTYKSTSEFLLSEVRSWNCWFPLVQVQTERYRVYRGFRVRLEGTALIAGDHFLIVLPLLAAIYAPQVAPCV